MGPNDDLMDLLVSIVDQTGEKFVCLIDEWDALCREGYEELADEYVGFLRPLFKGSKTEYVLYDWDPSDQTLQHTVRTE